MGINRSENNQNIFLPMFCRLSIKDVKLNTIPISAAAAEPSSPKVTCMGQVKRNNRVTGFPLAAANHHKYTKSKSIHLFAKTLLPNPTAAAKSGGGGRSGSRSCRANREVCLNNVVRRSRVKTNCDDDQEMDISGMDPPLPVVKRAATGRDEMNIWKRRSNGVRTALQIEPIDLPNNKFLTPLSTS